MKWWSFPVLNRSALCRNKLEQTNVLDSRPLLSLVMGDGHVGLGVKCSKEVSTAIRGAMILATLYVDRTGVLVSESHILSSQSHWKMWKRYTSISSRSKSHEYSCCHLYQRRFCNVHPLQVVMPPVVEVPRHLAILWKLLLHLLGISMATISDLWSISF